MPTLHTPPPEAPNHSPPSSLDVERIVLFGSRARGTATKESDVDLLVVMQYRGGETDQAVAILSRTNRRFAVDLPARTPADDNAVGPGEIDKFFGSLMRKRA